MATPAGLYIELHVDASRVPQAAAHALLDLFCRQICQQDDDDDNNDISGREQHVARLSILNYPPRTRPVPFPQEPAMDTFPALLHGCFERRAQQHPQRVAIDFLALDDVRQQYSYQHVDSAAACLATALLSQCPHNAKNPIAIVMGPSPEMYLSYLAVLKSGRPFCPIPTDAPVDRQLMMLGDLNCSAIITRDRDSALPLFTAMGDVPVLNASSFLATETPAVMPPCIPTIVSPELLMTARAEEDDLAYIMYTSGTTGRPKGVQISHLSAACSIAAHSAVAPLSSSAQAAPTRWFQFAAPTFDPSIMEIFVTLSSGGTLCTAERQLTLDDINAVLAQLDVDVMMATPSLASLLEPRHLKSLWTMGEALSARVIRNFEAHNPNLSHGAWDPSTGPRGLYNAYGPTEASINCTLLNHVPGNNRGSVLGPPLPSCSLIVVSEHDPLQPVPWACPGELLIAGPQVASRGYLNRPEETAKAFLPSTRWGRAYRTGDRARIVWDSKTGEASVEFLGRISTDQVKLSGRRVELGEIDAAILTVGEVREALTVIYKPHGNGSSGSEKPVSAISLVNDSTEWTVVKSRIETTVANALPPFMRPYRLFHLPQIPRSAAGKLDRKALSLMLHDKIQAETHAASPGQEADINPAHLLPLDLVEVEQRLLDILADIVGAHVSPAANLVLDVGLDSLRAMQFLSRVRAEHLLNKISLQNLLSGSSIRGLLLHQTNGHDSSEFDSLLQSFSRRNFETACHYAGLRTEDVEKVSPATSTQSGMVASFIRSSNRAQKTYINHSCYHLRSESLDVGRLATAIEDVLLMREAYRTTFVPVDDPLAPFAQCIISQQAAQRDGKKWCRVIHRHGSEPEEHWLRQAEVEINLENNVLYRFQIIDNHTLIISLFHGIFDGASLELLLVDIDRRYRGLPLDTRSEISLAAELDFSSRSAEGDDFWLRETADYQVENLPRLSGNKAQPPSTSSESETRVAYHTTTLTYADLQARSREIQASALSVWQTAWALLLSSFSESRNGDIMFGSVVSNRFHAESAACHGPTFSMLPCRVHLTNKEGFEMPVGQLASEVTRTSARILAHPHPSLGLITTPEGRLPFDSILALQHFEIDSTSKNKDDSLWDRISWPAMRNDFNVMLEVWPCDSHIPRVMWKPELPMMVKMTFDTNSLSDQAAARILAQLSYITESILARPEQLASDTLGSMPTSLLAAQNINPTKLDENNMLLHSQFESEARRNPAKVALVFRHSWTEPPLELTYGEMDEQADYFARRLHHHYGGKAPVDKVIPICLEKSPEMYIAVLGILKAGAAWCPIDTSFPPQRKLELVKRTGSSLLVTSRSSQHHVKASLPPGSTMILVDVVTSGTEPLDFLAPVPLLAEHLAYLIWTSGTTGAPKGVMVEHTAAFHAMRALQDAIPTSVDASTGQYCPPRVLNFCAYSFDVFVQDLFYTWGLGGTLISSTREIMLGNFIQLAVEMHATHAHLTPSFSASVRRQDLGESLQVVTMIGEKLTESVANDWSWHTKAFNTYGPAENAVVSTLRQFGNSSDDNAKAANVGWSLSSVSSFVVHPDPPHHLVPFYGVGELALGGHQLARGYLNDPVKTQSRFVWSSDLQQRIYLTGDIVRMVDHGIEFLGRNDDLVKLNGIRVELSEISATLSQTHPDIEHIETLLLTHPDRPVKAVVSFTSLRNDAADAPLVALDKRAFSARAEILTAAHQLLPDYMVPSFFIPLNRMPRTASNKVDRKVLQNEYESLDLSQFDTSSYLLSTAPKAGDRGTKVRTPIEDRVVIMLSELSGLDPSAITDEMSLARLGIHSISAIRLAWRLKKEADIDVAMVTLLTCSTIGQLLGKVSESTADNTHGGDDQDQAAQWLDSIERQLFHEFAVQVQSQASLTDQVINAIRPVTAMQEGLIIETLRNDRSYWSHRMFRLPDGVDTTRLRAAWEQVAQDNEILRTGFLIAAEIDHNVPTWLKDQGIQSAVLQAVTSPAVVRWSEVEWDPSSYPLTTIADELARRARNEASPIASCKLVSPWSISILRNSATREAALMMHIHHALHDAQSMDAIFDDVFNHYYQHSSRVPRRTQFSDAIRRGIYLSPVQTQNAQQHVSEFYSGLVKQFGPVTTTKWPDMTGSRQLQERRILRTTVMIGPTNASETWKRLQAAKAKYALGAPTRIVSAAFGCVVAEYLESKYIVLGETVSQRLHHATLQSVLGPLVATVPTAVRIDLSASETLSNATSTTTVAGGALHHVHPATLRNTLGITSDQPLYPALIVFHPHVDEEFDEKQSSAFWDEMDDIVGLCVEHPLALNIFEEKAGLRVELSGDNQAMSQQQLDMLIAQVMSQLELMLAQPDVPLEELNNVLPPSLLSVTPATKVSMRHLDELVQKEDWANIAVPTINPVAWVEYHARHHPEWIAAEEILDVDEPEQTRRWTYSQLLSATSRVLATLQKRGIARGSVVSIHLGRTLESFAAILALFRGGYIYLPLDEELPAERTRLLTVDAGARAFITTQDLLNELMDEKQMSWCGNIDLVMLEDISHIVDATPNLPEYTSARHSTDDGYILFTSGSTGKPKGVRVTNSNLCNFIECLARQILDNSPETKHLGGVGKYLNLASRAFDPHLTHMFMAWRLGLAATIGPRMMMLGNLESVIVQNSITHFGTVPSVLQQARLSPERVPSVVFVTVGGEKVSNDVLAMWTEGDESERPRPLMMNVYGPTECTIGCVSNIVTRSSNARNIGQVFDCATAIVLATQTSGAEGEPIIAKRGQTGELCIAGDLVSLGYMDRPEAQAKAFATMDLLPAAAEDGSRQTIRYYRTGDLVRMMSDGCIEYLGRSDQQAKVNGQRLELGEVEHFLRRTAKELHLDVEFAAAVIQHPDLPRPRLYAFIASLSTEDPAASEQNLCAVASDPEILAQLSDACSKSLPAFMVPDLVWINRIPFMKASGKVDAKQLNALVRSLPLSKLHQDHDDSGQQEASQALTEDEEIVVKAIEGIVGSSIGRPEANRSIFELGVDSLSAVHLSARLKQLGLQVTAADVLSHATIRNLAQHRKTPAAHNDLATAIRQAEERLDLFDRAYRRNLVGDADHSVEHVLPTMPLQSALLARSMAQIEDDEDASNGVLYVSHFRYSLAHSTDLQRFIGAVERVLQEEKMLRTCFRQTTTGAIAQVVLSQSPVSDLVIPVQSSWESWLASHSPNTIAHALVKDVARLPPVRVHIFEGQSGEVLLSMHHSLFDGDAIKQIRLRIQELYNGEVCQETSAAGLVQLVTQFEATDLQASQAFWERNLLHAEPCLVVEDEMASSSKETDSTCRSTKRLLLPLAQLRTAAQANNTSLNAIFQTTFALLLSELHPLRSEVVFGCVLSLRPLLSSDIDGTAQLIAPLLNTLPQRVQLSLVAQNGGPLRHLGQAVRENLSETMQHAFVPLDRILKWCQLDQALFDAIISVNFHTNQHDNESGTGSGAQPGSMILMDTLSVANIPFAADVNVHDDPLGNSYVEIELSSSAAQFDVDRLSGLAKRFDELCTTLVESPKMPLTSLLPSLSTTVGPTALSDSRDHEMHDSSPWSAEEELVRDVICELLNIPAESLGKQQSFYRLGMDSILVLRMVKLLRERTGVKLSPLAVLRARCAASVAQLISAVEIAQSSDSALKQQQELDDYTRTLQTLSGTVAEDHGVESTFFATPIQQGMLSAALSSTDTTNHLVSPYIYRHTFEVDNHSTFDLGAFQQAWKRTVVETEILRTTFHFTDNKSQPWLGVVRRLQDDEPGVVRVFSSSREAACAPFDIDVSTRLAHCALVIPPSKSEPIMVVFTMHHAIYDGASLPLLWRTFIDIYRALSEGRVFATRPQISFSSVARQVAVQQSSAVKYWVKNLNGYTYEPLGPRIVDDTEQEASNKINRFRSHAHIPLEQFENVKRRCQELGVTVQSALVLAWSKVLAHDILGQSDVAFGQVLNGQFLALGGEEADHQQVTGDYVIGPTFNTVAMRVALDPALSNRQALEKIQKLSEEAQHHQVASLRTVQNEWRSSTSAGHASNLFESLFLFNGENTSLDSQPASQQPFWKPSKLEGEDDEDGFAEVSIPCCVKISS